MRRPVHATVTADMAGQAGWGRHVDCPKGDECCLFGVRLAWMWARILGINCCSSTRCSQVCATIFSGWSVWGTEWSAVERTAPRLEAPWHLRRGGARVLRVAQRAVLGRRVGMEGFRSLRSSGSCLTLNALNAQCVTKFAARLAGNSAVKVLRNWPELLRTPATLARLVG